MANIGFVGLGMMGTPMAACLAKAGHALFVKDASAEVQASFVQNHGGQVLDSKTAADVEWLVLMLPNSAIVEKVLAELVSQIPKTAAVIDMSSSAPLNTRALSESLAEHGVQLLDAPVSGGQKRAIDGTLAIMVGGQAELYEKAEPILAAMGSAVHVGPVGAGHALKALNNYLSAAGLLAAVEAFHVGEKFGLDPAVMNKVFNTSSGRNNTTENKVEQFMLSGKFNSAFSLALMAKDLGIAVDLGEKMGEPMLLAHTCRDIWKEVDSRAPNADHTEMYRLV